MFYCFHVPPPFLFPSLRFLRRIPYHGILSMFVWFDVHPSPVLGIVACDFHYKRLPPQCPMISRLWNFSPCLFVIFTSSIVCSRFSAPPLELQPPDQVAGHFFAPVPVLRFNAFFPKLIDTRPLVRSCPPLILTPPDLIAL